MAGEKKLEPVPRTGIMNASRLRETKCSQDTLLAHPRELSTGE